MPTSICPECDEEVYVDAESTQGDRVTCDECGAHLVIVGLDPIEMDLYEESESDDLDEEEDFESYDYETERLLISDTALSFPPQPINHPGQIRRNYFTKYSVRF